jgi:hypothetical protein
VTNRITDEQLHQLSERFYGLLSRAMFMRPFVTAYDCLSMALNAFEAELKYVADATFGPWPVGMKVAIDEEYAKRPRPVKWVRGTERVRVVDGHSWHPEPTYGDDAGPVLILTPGVLEGQQYVAIPVKHCRAWQACASYVEGKHVGVCAHCGDVVEAHQLEVSSP